MNSKNIYTYLTGYVIITVEGFFIERFINSCFSKNILLFDLKRERSAFLIAKLKIDDFKKIKSIAKKTGCKVRIIKKNGLPIFINKYKKRKFLFFSVIFIFILIFITTRFIWNIDISGNKELSKESIIEILKEEGIDIGVKKKDLNIEKIINEIRLKNDDISWIGIDIKGTNLIVNITEADKSPEVIDLNEVCNIVADKEGEIASIVVHNGTARVQAGDNVKVGDLLVEGIMEGKYTGIRKVHALADITANMYVEKEKKEMLFQEEDIKTGNEEKNIEIKINKFKINFNKGVSKFKKYDTIMTTKKMKIFSNYYLPIEVSKITNFETEKIRKEYTVTELVEKLKEDLKKELNEELNLQNEDNIKEQLEVEVENEFVNVKLIYIMQEKIGTKEN